MTPLRHILHSPRSLPSLRSIWLFYLHINVGPKGCYTFSLVRSCETVHKSETNKTERHFTCDLRGRTNGCREHLWFLLCWFVGGKSSRSKVGFLAKRLRHVLHKRRIFSTLHPFVWKKLTLYLYGCSHSSRKVYYGRATGKRAMLWIPIRSRQIPLHQAGPGHL